MCNITDDPTRFWIEGVASPIGGVLGIFGNVVALAVLFSKKLDLVYSVRYLFIQLTICDLLVLVSGIFIICPGNWSEYYKCHLE